MSAARGRWKGRHKERDEAGAVAIITGVLMSFVLIAIAAFTVDLGMQRVVRRDMQALADVVALDLARLLDGRLRNDIQNGVGGPPLDAALEASVLRNDTTTLGEDPDCDNNDVVGYATMTNVGTSCVYVYLVKMNADGTYPTVAGTEGRPQNVGNSPPQAPDGVVVFASSSVDFAFGLAASGSATRSAVAATSEPTLCFSLGTTALALDTSKSALNPILAGLLHVDTDVLGPEGIVDLKDASVQLVDLAAELGLGTPTELLAADVGLGELAVAAAAVLERNGDLAAVTALEAITASVGSATVRLGEILSVDSGTPMEALTADINVLNLVTAHAFAANGENALGVTIPGITSVQVIEPPQISCGTVGATAKSAQVRLRLDPTLATDLLPPELANVDVSLDVHVADGFAELTDLDCSPQSAEFDIEAGVLQLPPLGPAPSGPPHNGQWGQGLTADAVDLNLGLLGLQAEITAKLGAAVGGSTGTESVTFPDPDPVTVPTGALGNALGLYLEDLDVDATVLVLGVRVPVLPATLDLLMATLKPIVNGLVGTLNTALTPILDALLGALGIKLGVAEMDFHGPPVCNNVRLIG